MTLFFFVSVTLISVYLIYSYVDVTYKQSSEMASYEYHSIWQLIYSDADVEKILDEVRASGVPVDSIQQRGDSLLSVAVVKENEALVLELLKLGADPNGLRPTSSPLFYSIGIKNTDIAEHLLDYGADPDLFIEEGMTLRELIEISGSNELRELVGKKSVTDKKTGQGQENGEQENGTEKG